MNCAECGKYASPQRLYTLNYAGVVLGYFDCLDCLMQWSAKHSAPTEAA